MPSAAKLAQGALANTQPSKSSMMARIPVAIAGAAISMTTAPTMAAAATSDSKADDRIAGHSRRPPSFCLGVRKNAARPLHSPRTASRASTQLKANQIPIARKASPQEQRSARRSAHKPPRTPEARKGQGPDQHGTTDVPDAQAMAH